jgi:hypothetical protein
VRQEAKSIISRAVPRKTSPIQFNSIQFNSIQFNSIRDKPRKKLANSLLKKRLQPKPKRSSSRNLFLILRRMKKEENVVNVCRKKKLWILVVGDIIFGGEIWQHDDFPLLLLVLSGFSVH